MNISIFGLGYVGSVSAACFAKMGHHVIAVEPNASKRTLVASGKSPVIESELERLLNKAVTDDRLQVTACTSTAVRQSDISLVCVGTPSRRDGSLNLDYVQRVCEEIGRGIADKPGFHVVAIRSTVLPGVPGQVCIPAIEQSSGKRVDEDFGFCVNPEFLREGTAIADFENPPYTIIGGNSERAVEHLARVYDGISAPMIFTGIDAACAVKYANNAFHALKVVFGNEIGTYCKRHGIDSHIVMDVVCKDTKLNLSPAYLKPGFAFGGSCLPKDVRALLDDARAHKLELPMIASILGSNERHVRELVHDILSMGKCRVAVLGLAFKNGTDDLRESPIVSVVEALIGKGYDLKIYDKFVNLANLTGSNRDFILREIPHISSLLTEDLRTALEDRDVVILANHYASDREQIQDLVKEMVVIDLARLFSPTNPIGKTYYGIAW